MKKIITLCLVALIALGAKAQLKFNSDKTFKIVQFTDVHWVPGNSDSEEAAQRMNEILDSEKPDLVVYTGDLIFAKPASVCLDETLKPAISRGLPFAVVLGNHDDEQDMKRKELLEYISKKKGNLTSTTANISGVTNFILPIQHSSSSKNASILYFLDSHGYSKIPEAKGYDWMKQDQIEWYTKESKKYTQENLGKPLPSLAFFHIPFPEYNQAASDEDTPLIGTRREKACSPVLNTGMFTAMFENGDIMGTFVGHDHINDYATYWKGILLAYGRFTGGKTVYHDIPGGNGARVILLKEDERTFDTWECLKGNKIINKVTYPSDFVKSK